ncbi:MAG TPA: cytochrome c [Acidimicrobiales bacterium]|nr:cytochrome c [Acidimicrobiales bacterium]
MSPLSISPAVLAASTVTTIGATLVVLLLLGLLAYVVANLRAGRPETGSEIELAPNRRPYHDDETLETTVLNRTLRWALVLLVVIAVALPLYWLAEPGRQSGAVENFERVFASRGEELYVTGSQCQNCHGPEGTGGQAPYTVTNADGEFVATVTWRAPALDTVLLRFSRDEVEYIINYGRPFSPMAGWGASVNKGPLNEQQVSNLVDYLESIQLSPAQAQREAEEGLVEQLGLVDEGASKAEMDAAIKGLDYDDPQVGRTLFNLETSGGAFACARCHTRGWSIIRTGEDVVQPPDAPLEGVYVGFPDGSGALGPNLTGGLIPRQFADYTELVGFVSQGSIDGEPYGNNGIGSGRMPGFADNPNTEEVEGDGMLTPEMVAAIARYEATLPASETPNPKGAPSVSQIQAQLEKEEG